MKRKNLFAGLLAGASIFGLLAGCSSQGAVQSPAGAGIAPSVENLSVQTAQNEAVAPKYVFLFIGDGMSYPQIQSTADYLRLQLLRPRLRLHRHFHRHWIQDLLRIHQRGRDGHHRV